MKKYFMLMITIIMLLLTTVAYKYENNFKVPQIKQPCISMDSQKFGLIKKIVWTKKYMNDSKSLIILSSRTTDQGTMSYLYHLNVDTGKSEQLAEFPAHKNLNSEILFGVPSGINCVAAAYDKGIIKVSYPTDHTGSASLEKIEIDGFDTATSMDFKSNLIYTRENDNLLYLKNLSTAGFSGVFTNNAAKDMITYYTKPLYIVNLNSLNNIITYTSMNYNRIDLFAMKDGVSVNTLNLPIIKNVVSVRGIEDSFGFTGMNILSENIKKLNLFMIRNTIDKYNNDDYYSLDTIPYNTDPFGAVPSFDSITYNKKFSLAYTSYDENHKGSLKICGLNQKPKVIVNNENLFGPISITGIINNDNYIPYILYFTSENNNIRIKVCSGDGDLVKDITDMVLKNN